MFKQLDLSEVLAIVALAVIAVVAMLSTKITGETVAAAVVGGLAGWLTRGAHGKMTVEGDPPKVTTEE